MAVTSYEVGAIFTIGDKASTVLLSISKQLSAMQGQVDRLAISLKDFGANTGLSGFNRQLGIANKRIDTLGGGFSKSVGSISAGTNTTIAELGRIDAAAAATRANLAGISVGGVGGLIRGGPGRSPSGPAGSGRGGSGVGSFTGPSFGVPGGSRLNLGGNAALAGVGMLGYGAYLEAQMQDAIFQLLYHTGQADTPETREKFSRIIQDAMASTGSSLSAVADAAKQEVRMFKGTPGGGVDVLPEMLRAAATEARLKGTSLEESMSALIGLAHMTKEYNPEQIKKLAPAFAFLSASNPASLGGIERAASYAVPILQSGLDVDPVETLLLGTALTRAGATNTKSGTWLRNMALNAMPGTSLMSKIAFEKHEAALKKLGLVDGNDKPTWFTDGKPDLIKMLSIAGDNAAKIPLIERAGYEKQLFGTQGFGGFALLADPAVKQQIASLMKDMNSSEFKNRYASFMEDYSAGSPVQKARQSWADLQNVLMSLGNTVLPGVTRGLGLWTRCSPAFRRCSARRAHSSALNDDQKTALKGITDGLDIFIGRLKGIAGAISGLFGGGAGPGAPAPLPYGHPMHPSGLGPQSPLYPHQSQADTPVHIKTAIYMDGRIIGETISSELAQLSTFPRQAPFSDTYLGWAAPDYNFGTG